MSENLPLPIPANIVITSLKMYDLAQDYYITISAKPVLTSNTTYYFPNDGVSGQALVTDGLGNLSWTNVVKSSGTATVGTLPQVSNTSLTNITPTNMLITNSGNDLTIPGTAHLTTTTGFTNTAAIINYTNVPSTALELVSKQYVDTTASGLHVLPACTCVSSTNLTALYNNGASGVGATLTNTGAFAAFSADSYSPAINSRVLVAGQSTQFQNGIYTLTTVGDGVTAWVLTRATDYDTPVEINPGDYVLIQNGTLYYGSTWIQTSTVTSIGVNSIVFVMQNPSAGLTAGNGITISSTTISANINTTNLKFTTSQINTIQDITTTSSPTFSNITATLLTAAQPNITSVGSLTSLDMNGIITSISTLNSSGNTYAIDLRPAFFATSSVTRAAGIYLSVFPNPAGNTITTMAQIYIDTGTYMGGTVTTGYGIYAELPSFGTTKYAGYFNGATYVNGTLTATNLAGTISTAAQPNITSLGTLTGLDMDGTITYNTTRSVSTNTYDINLSNVFLASSPVSRVAGLYSNLYINPASDSITTAAQIYIDTGTYMGGTVTTGYGIYVELPAFGTTKYAGYFNGATYVNGTLTATNLAGTISTAAQPNITSLGTLTGLDVDGTITYNTTRSVSTTTYDINLSNVFLATGSVSRVAGLYSNLYINPASNSITTAAQIYIDTGTYMSGTVTTGYGIYVELPAFGTTKYAGYFNGATYVNGTLTATNLAGTISTAAQPNITSLGTLTGLDMAGTITYTSTRSVSTTTYDINLSNTYLATGSVTRVAGLYTNLAINASTNSITTAAQVYIDAGSYVGGTVTYGYGLYVTLPAFGSNKIATYTDNMAVGSVAIPPTNGIIVNGSISVSLTADNHTAGLYVNKTVTTINDSVAFGIYDGVNFAPTGSANYVVGLYSVMVVTAQSGQTITSAASLRVYNQANSNEGTITTLYGILVDAGTTSIGTVPNSYGVYINTPLSGTHSIALYSDNLAIGYTGIVPPTNGAIITGTVGIGTSAPDANSSLYVSKTLTGTTGGYAAGIYCTTTFNPTAGATNQLRGISSQPTFSCPAAQTINAVMASYTTCQISSNSGSITTAYGSFIDTGTTNGTVTTGYGLYVQHPAYGTSKYTAFFAGPTMISSTIAGVTLNVGTYSTSYYSVRVRPTITVTDTSTTAGGMRGVDISPTFQHTSPSSGSSQISMSVSGTYNALTSGTLDNAYGIYISNSFSGNTQTITTYRGIYYDGGSSGSGTITNAYAAYLTMPNAGSSKFGLRIVGSSTVTSGNALLGLYVDCDLGSSSGTVGNIYHGYIYPSHTSNSATVTQAIGFMVDSGTTAGTITNGYSLYATMPAYGSTSRRGILLSGSQTMASTGSLIGMELSPSLGCSSGTMTDSEVVYIYPNFSANSATITSGISLLIAAGSAGAGTITNGYGLYVTTPAYGTNKYCAYFTGGVGIGVTPPNNTAGLTLPTSGGTPANLNYYEEYSASYTWQTIGGGGTTASVTIYIYKVGKMCTMLIPSFLITAAGGAGLNTTSAIPSRFYPVVQTASPSINVVNAGSGTQGNIVITTAGAVRLYQSSNFSAFSAGTAGINTENVSFSYLSA